MPEPDQINTPFEVSNISDYLKHFAEVSPDKPALLYIEKVTYWELEKKNQIEITKTLFNVGSVEIDLCTFPLPGFFVVFHKNSSLITRGKSDILFNKKYPFDPRYNARIFRKKLAIWATK